jgi:hypothetical protein
MNTQGRVRLSLVALCIGTLVLGSTATFARGFGGSHVVARGGYGHAVGGYRGGYNYGYRGGYRGGYYGGWGALGLGLFVASLPLYYSTYYWNGVPYYYADDYYYRYDNSARRYERVTPPSGLRDQAASGPPAGSELFAYPKNGQSEEQQARDKNECKDWARTQVGSADSSDAGSPTPEARDAEYVRAQTACLEGRGYSVK